MDKNQVFLQVEKRLEAVLQEMKSILEFVDENDMIGEVDGNYPFYYGVDDCFSNRDLQTWFSFLEDYGTEKPKKDNVRSSHHS
jgi:hypothetical protein